MELSSPFYIFNPNSSTNHAFVILVDALVILISIFLLVQASFRVASTSSGVRFTSTLGITSAIFNCGLGLSYLGVGLWLLLHEKQRRKNTILPIDEWLVVFFQGTTWLLLGITLSLKRQSSHILVLKLYSAFAILVSGFICIPSLWESVGKREISVKRVLDVLVLPGVNLLLFSAVQGCGWKWNATEQVSTSGNLSRPEIDENLVDIDDNITPFSKAGYFSRLTFCWLNPLIKKGKNKTLGEKDIPGLRYADKAQTCYSLSTNTLSQNQNSFSPFLSLLFLLHQKEIIIAGIFALLKVLAISACPLIVKVFIEVADGKEAFKHEGYTLSAALLLAKCIQSLSERQWYFRMRLIGIRMRSMLCTKICDKVLKLSSGSKITTGQVMSYVTADTCKIGEFPYWLHHAWATALQLLLALLIIYHCVGVAAFVTLIMIILSVVANFPVAKLQHKYHIKCMRDQDRILQAVTEAVMTMKVLKLYAWETRFMKTIEGLRRKQYKWLKGVQIVKCYSLVLFWSSPILVPITTLWACYFLGIPLKTSKIFTFLATLALIQEPVKSVPGIFEAFIGAQISFDRIMSLLTTAELSNEDRVPIHMSGNCGYAVHIKASGISWERNSIWPILKNIDVMVKPGERVAICGEVGAGKTTLLSAILGEVPCIDGVVDISGKIAYVSQAAWIQTGSIQENILFGSTMDSSRYQDILAKCSLLKDLEMLPYGDLTVIGERGVNLSGGQKQRIQLARALYQNADVYLLDDPFSAVDAHTATYLFNECVMGYLSGKTVLLVTHQVDFLSEFDAILLLSEAKVTRASYDELLATSEEFRSFVNSNEITPEENPRKALLVNQGSPKILHVGTKEALNFSDQLIKQEAREIGDAGFKPYFQYLKHGKTLLYIALSNFMQCLFILGNFAQYCLIVANVRDSGTISKPIVIAVYSAIGCSVIVFLLCRTYFLYIVSLGASRSIFSLLLKSLFRAPMSFYDSTPLGRVLSRVSYDLSIVDLDVPLKLILSLGTTMNVYFGFGVLVFLCWETLLVIIPTLYLVNVLQKYYYASARELMRMVGTTKSCVASHFSETASGLMTIRAFRKEDQFLLRTMDLLDRNANASFHSLSANEWCILRLEIMYAVVLSTTALFMSVLPHKDLVPGFIAMALTYGLALSYLFTLSFQSQCDLANMMVSVERLEQYMHIESEAPEIINDKRPFPGWPNAGKVEICKLKVKYQRNAPFVLRGISCVFEGGYKIGIVGRTGCGKTTLVNTLFRLVEPSEGKIVVDGIDISTIGLHDLRSHFGVIPQEPILFQGSVRFNLDPLSEHTDKEIWEVLDKCQLKEAVQEKQEGLDTLVVQNGSNWSMGERQLFCLGRALLKRRRVLVLDEATASIDNTTDSIIQKLIRSEFKDTTVITVAHRIPTVMDCTKVLALSDGELVEFDDPKKLMNKEDSLFALLVREYWSRSSGDVMVHKEASTL